MTSFQLFFIPLFFSATAESWKIEEDQFNSAFELYCNKAQNDLHQNLILYNYTKFIKSYQVNNIIKSKAIIKMCSLCYIQNSNQTCWYKIREVSVEKVTYISYLQSVKTLKLNSTCQYLTFNKSYYTFQILNNYFISHFFLMFQLDTLKWLNFHISQFLSQKKYYPFSQMLVYSMVLNWKSLNADGTSDKMFKNTSFDVINFYSYHL